MIIKDLLNINSLFQEIGGFQETLTILLTCILSFGITLQYRSGAKQNKALLEFGVTPLVLGLCSFKGDFKHAHAS